MTTLVQAALSLRKGVRVSYGYLGAAALGLLTLLGIFRERSALGVEHALVGAAWVMLFGLRASARMQEERKGARKNWFDLELGILLWVAAHAVLQLFGGLDGPFYPVLYVLIAFVSSFAERGVGRALLVFAIGFEAALYFLTEQHTDPKPFALHACFLAMFGVLSVLFTQAEISRVRMRSERELQDDKKRVREDARMFRLVAAPTSTTTHDEEKLNRSSVEEVHHALLFNLTLLKRTMGLHTAALLMRSDTGELLRIVELISDSDEVAEGPFPLGGGAVGAALQRGLIMNLEHLRPGYAGICYYRGPTEVKTFVAVPVREGTEIRGVLCADRLDDRAFTPHDEETLLGAVEHVLRAFENERVFVQLERAKREHSALHRASEALGAALNEQDVLDAAIAAAEQIAPYDFAAITRYDTETRQHSVRRAIGHGSDQFANLSFQDNTSLTAMAIKNRHYLPYRGEFDSGSQVVYTRKANLHGMDSLLILPLVVRDVPIGTLALAGKRPDMFGPSVRPALQALANQVAVALSNAASVKRLEELATTDGLTGCFNKRYFNEQLKAKLQAAQRFDRKLSLIITDIDHFKGVNDTYGHATGDVVIQELGAILQRLKRETDVVARFGGEEFCVLCEETDTDGAVLLAERVRKHLEDTVFETEHGKLQVTCSLGVASFPQHAADADGLFRTADRALYTAKHGGRNRVCAG